MGKKLTLSEFIKKAKEVHGDKYDYSKVNYIDNKTKVCIICPEHGEFLITPNNHLRGHGCPKCGHISGQRKQTKTKKEFIKESNIIFNGKYAYDKFEYIKSSIKGVVICPEHGEFLITPNNHLRGHGCPKCAGCNKSNNDTFVTMAKEIHGDKYDYSKVEYVNNRTKVCIICPEHGEFWQKPILHITQKCGCPKCGGRCKLTTEEFIKRAKEIHGDKYDYSKVLYINNATPVNIICNEHGDFWKIPSGHLQGQGCPKCGYKNGGIKNALDYDIWKSRCEKIHNKRYSYDKTNYTHLMKTVNIICPVHGEFLQVANDHMHGSGCPFCNRMGGKEELKLYDKINDNFETVVKQKHFKWLGRKSFDIFIEKYNIAIEYQGVQHFEETSFFDQETVNKQIENDIKKLEESKKHNILLLYYVPKKYYKWNNMYSVNTYTRYDRIIKRIKKEIAKKNG